jgi:hypothetical protein
MTVVVELQHFYQLDNYGLGRVKDSSDPPEESRNNFTDPFKEAKKPFR